MLEERDQQLRAEEEVTGEPPAWKAEVKKACEIALDDRLDLVQIDEDKNPEYFTKRGVKRGIARRFVKDIRFWAENIMVV